MPRLGVRMRSPGRPRTLIAVLVIIFMAAGVSSSARGQEAWREDWISGRRAFEEGRHAEAEQSLSRALEAARSQKAEQADLALILVYVGLAQWRAGKDGAAVSSLEESVRLWKTSKTPGHPDFAAALSYLGLLYALTGYESGACDPAQQAVKKAEEAAAAGEGSLVQALNTLGMLEQRGACGGGRTRTTRAEELFRRAMTTGDARLSADDPLRALSLENYARTLENSGRAGAAIPHRREATRIRNAIIQKLQGVKADSPPPPEKARSVPQRVGKGVTQPSLLWKDEPEYSELARLVKLQGTVVLSFVVNEEGNAQDVRLAKGLGLGLDEQAYRAVRTWKFKPATKDGRPVAVYATVEVNFRLL